MPTLSLKLKKQAKDVEITIVNPQPHNIPSGFGSRELLLELKYKKASKTIDKQTISLTTHYISKRGKPTIPHLAVKQSKDMSIPADSKKVLKVPSVDGANEISVTIYYRLVNDEIRGILNLNEAIWSKKNFITTKTLKL